MSELQNVSFQGTELALRETLKPNYLQNPEQQNRQVKIIMRSIW